MKKWAVILALFMIAKPVLPVLEYAVLYDYISKELCINKETPKMGCNGKCYLMKELSRSSENENSQSPQKKLAQAEHILLYFVPETNYNLGKITPNVQTSHSAFEYKNLYSHLVNPSIFRPPVAA